MVTFRRYTNLAAAIHMLRHKTITLLNPDTWDDWNDAYFMAEYKRQKGAASVLALCFAECDETYHHWRVFSHGTDGVCIEFDRKRLLSMFAGDSLVRHGYVKYRLIDTLNRTGIKMEDLPFLKRRGYRDEKEYRVIFVDDNNVIHSQEYEIDLAWIIKIVLSPWIPIRLGMSVRDNLKEIDGCSHLPIGRSTLINSDQWRKLADRVSTP